MANINELRQQGAKAPAKSNKDKLKDLLHTNRASIAAGLPKSLTYDRLHQVALLAMTNTPGLTECSVPSVFTALIKAGSLGLEVNSALGHAYLIPYKNNKNQRTDCQLIIGYKGLLDLARKSGKVVNISAHEVRERDKFDWAYGLNERLEHVPASGDRGEITHFYAVARFTDGGHALEVMSKAEVDEVRASSKTGKFGPWADHYVQMGRKTVIRRLANYLPLSVEMAEATRIDDQDQSQNAPDYSDVLEGEFNNLTTETGEPLKEAMSQDTSTAQYPFGADPDGSPLDINGEIFNPRKHQTKDGGPVFDENGTFVAKAASKRPDLE